jgi:uncharacterized protein (TIGR01370 family)
MPSTLNINTVNSFAYVIAPNQAFNTILGEIQNSPYELTILGNVSKLTPGLIHSSSFPLANKLVVGYVDVGESTALVTYQYFGNSLPSWFGNLNPGFPNLYTVQYWQPQWLEAIKGQINQQITAGFDGVFLDVLTADEEWSSGNIEGNPVVADATVKLATLVQQIHDYVQSLHLSRPFYLIGNNPGGLAQKVPGVLNNLDAIFQESAYWNQSATNGAISVPAQISPENWLQTLSKLYVGKTVFANDYPPLDSPSTIIPILQKYSSLGWTAGLQKALQTPQILTNGPYVLEANSSQSTISGGSQGTNYLLSGQDIDCTLVGGVQAKNYFIAGAGQNTIYCGNANDVIYMHPHSTYLANTLELTFASTIKGVATIPSISVLLNGTSVLSATNISAIYGQSSQTFEVSLSGVGQISSLQILANTSYSNSTNFSNVALISLSANNNSVDPSTAQYTNGASINGFHYTNTGSITFNGNSFSNVPSSLIPKDVVTGGRGLDMGIYETTSNGFVVNLSSSVASVNNVKYGISDTLTNVERLKFTDTNIALDVGPAQNAGSVYMLYKAAFNRAPDASGMGYWLAQKDGGSNIVTNIAQGFVDAPEFVAKYGSNPSNASYVDKLYQNVLGRAGEAGGVAYWNQQLDAGNISKAAVLVQFATLAEGAANVASLIANGIPYTEYVG